MSWGDVKFLCGFLDAVLFGERPHIGFRNSTAAPLRNSLCGCFGLHREPAASARELVKFGFVLLFSTVYLNGQRWAIQISTGLALFTPDELAASFEQPRAGTAFDHTFGPQLFA